MILLEINKGNLLFESRGYFDSDLCLYLSELKKKRVLFTTKSEFCMALKCGKRIILSIRIR